MESRRQIWRRSWLLLAVTTGAAVAGSVVHAHRQHAAASRASSLVTELATALGPVRSVEGRLTGGFGYAPFPTVPNLGSAVSQIRAVHRGPIENDHLHDPARLHDLARLRLLEGSPRRALRLLERATALAPATAEMLSDLAAVELELNRQDSEAPEALAALEAADLAVATDPRLPEARFNRALALARLYLDDEAAEAWRRYLDLDPGSSWALEAERHAADLRGRQLEAAGSSGRHRRELTSAASRGDAAAVHTLVAEDPQAARELIEDGLLPSWGEAQRRADAARSHDLLAAAGLIAGDLQASSGDSLLGEIVTTARAAATAEQAHLAHGLQLLGAGHLDLRNHRPASAANLLEQAAALLEEAHSPAALLAELHLASCADQQSLIAQAGSMLQGLAQNSQLKRYPSLAARVDWMTGMVEARRGNGALAVAAYARALQVFQGLRDLTGAASVECLLAEQLDLLGQTDAAWEHRLRALSWTAGRSDGTVVYNALDDTVVALLHSNRQGLALHFQNRLAAVADSLGQPEVQALTHVRRARILHALGRSAEAAADLDNAETGLAGADASVREFVEAEISLLRSELLDPAEPAQALAELTRAIDFHRRGGLLPLLPELLCQRARLHLAAGDVAAAERDLDLGIAEVERQRRQVDPGGERIPLFDQAEPLYATLLALQLGASQDEAAFGTAERFRARVLLDLWQGTAPQPASASSYDGQPLSRLEISARLPRGTTLVEYAVVNGRLVTWLCDRHRLARAAVDRPFAEIASDVQVLQDAVGSADDQRTKTLLQSLDQALVAPWQADVAPGETLIFIPTGVLHAVPFGALLDTGSGRFLVQDHAVGVAPSASTYVAALARVRSLAHTAPLRALVVGDARVAPATREADLLPQLPAAAAEARSIAALYPDAQLLVGDTATRQEVLSALPATEVAHFSTHAVDVDNPLRARLLLTGGIGASLSAADLSRLHLPRTRLVVLAACSTAVGRVSASEGPLSLAHAFAAAGVPTVLSSLWAVEDEPAARLFVRFHSLLRAGLGPLHALRTAQLEELARESPGWTWAALELVGAAADDDASTHPRG